MRTYINYPQNVVYLCLIILCSISNLVLAQAPDTTWTKLLGGGNDDYAHDVRQTSDGGYIITGQTGTVSGQPDSGNVYLARTNAAGEQLWEKIYGGTGRDNAAAVLQTADGGFAVAATTASFGNRDWDFWLLRTDANGDTLWTRRYGGNSTESVTDMLQTPDGGFILSGTTYSYGQGSSDFWLVRTDANGDTLWTKSYGGNGTEIANGICHSGNGGFAVTGRLSSFEAIGQSDMWLLRTDASGDTLWAKHFPGPGAEWAFNYGTAIQKTNDNGFIVIGETDLGTGGGRFYLVRTDANGDTLWTRNYQNGSSSRGTDILEMADGSFISTGYSLNTDLDLWLVGVSANGDSLWSLELGGSGFEQGSALSHTIDGGFVVAGFSSSYTINHYDAWLISFAGSTVSIGDPPGTILQGFQLLQNYPNPFNPKTDIRYQISDIRFINLTVSDILGKRVRTLVNKMQQPGTYTVAWDGRNDAGLPVAAGVYFYQLRAGEELQTRMMHLVK